MCIGVAIQAHSYRIGQIVEIFSGKWWKRKRKETIVCVAGYSALTNRGTRLSCSSVGYRDTGKTAGRIWLSRKVKKILREVGLLDSAQSAVDEYNKKSPRRGFIEQLASLIVTMAALIWVSYVIIPAIVVGVIFLIAGLILNHFVQLTWWWILPIAGFLLAVVVRNLEIKK